MPRWETERTGWRDQGLSDRHHDWGFDLPATDLDFILIEYDQAQPCALIEYKRESAPLPDLSKPNYKAFAILGERADLPCFVVRYAGDFSWWEVIPANMPAGQILAEARTVSERQYVRFLHWLRGRGWQDEMPGG